MLYEVITSPFLFPLLSARYEKCYDLPVVRAGHSPLKYFLSRLDEIEAMTNKTKNPEPIYLHDYKTPAYLVEEA